MHQCKWLALLLIASSACVKGPEPAATHQSSRAATADAPGRRPNIVLILADDLNVEVFNRMPRLASMLGRQGVTLPNNFVTLSLCCPSRTTLLRGQYAHNTQIFTNMQPGGGFAKVFELGLEDSTIATWLQAAGYRTVLLGKYLNGYPDPAGPAYVPPGWDEWYSANGGMPYSEYNYTLNENGRSVRYGNSPEDHMVDVLSNKTADFIRRTVAADPSQPFFIYVAPFVPHAPATPAPRYETAFPNEAAPRTASFNGGADNNDSKPAWVRNATPLTRAQIANIDALYRKRLQTMLSVEDLVDNVIQTLTATGQLDNTYVFFASDNGFHQGQHKMDSGKNTGYDEHLFVPLVVRGPNVPAGQRRTHFTVNTDLAPTFAALAGVAIPDSCDGRSLVPLLGARPPPVESWRQALLLEHRFPGEMATAASEFQDPMLEPPDPMEMADGPGTNAAGNPPVFQGVRTQTHTYIEYVTGELELYDNQADPEQLENIADTADPGLVSMLAAWLESLRACTGSDCRAAEDSPP